MDEILELQQQLAAIQQSSTAQRLSERNCIELVMKLQSLQLVDLIFTRSGKEYLTPAQLTVEVSDELLTRGGRVNVIDLPDALNVDLSHIEKSIDEIIDPPSVRLIRGELLTDYFLTSVAEEINDHLTSSEKGVDDVGSIASRYSLPVSVIREVITTHLGTIIDATLDPRNSDILLSAASLVRYRSAARGLLRATTTPTVLADLAKIRGLSLDVITEQVADMLKAGELQGSVTGRQSRATFIPKVYSDAALRVVLSEFASNGFVTLERLSKVHIADSTAFVDGNLPGALIMDECVVGPSLIETLETSAAEALADNSWLDVEVALPPGFPTNGVSPVMKKLVDSLQGGKDKKESQGTGKTGRSKRKTKAKTSAVVDEPKPCTSVVFGDRFLVSPGLISVFTRKLTADAVKRAEQRARDMTEKMSIIAAQPGVSAPGQGEDTASVEAGKKGKGKGRRRAGGKEKSARNDATRATSGIDKSNDSEHQVFRPSVEDAVDIILSDQECSSAVDTDYLGSSNAGLEMVSCVIEESQGEDGLSALYQSKAEEAVVSLLRDRAVAKKNADKALLADLEKAELYYKSASSFADEQFRDASRAFVMESMCVNAMCRIVDSVSQSTGVMDAAAAHAHELKSKREKLEVARATVEKFAPTLQTKLRSFLGVVSEKGGGNVPDFLSLYDENVNLLDLPERRPADKKAERAVFANARAELGTGLESENLSEKSCLNIAAVLVHAKTFGGTMISFPPESTIGFCKAIEEKAKPSEAGAALKELRESINGKGDELCQDAEDRQLNEGSAAKLATLRDLIG
eukprot:GFKZ01011545.1.p1 GENE.GFKZ01011545.1~~GFKZ01011545.1.p1  ORF type:complete len:804 (+),score=141.73 GFKZ01011545.1:221-2632(+)